MADELDKALQVITNAVQSHKECELEINKLKEEVIESNNNATDMRNKMETKFQSLKISSGQIMKEELTAHKAHLAKYSNQLLQKNKTIDEELKKYEAELKKTKCENELLKNQITVITKVQVNERIQLDQIEKQKNLLIEQNKLLIEQNKVLTSQVEILKDEIGALKIRIGRLEEKDSEAEVK